MTRLLHFRFGLVLPLVFAGIADPAQAKSVAASASAVADYVRPVNEAGEPRPESYVFAEGQFFEGSSVDRGIARTTFADITRVLAESLAKQKYFPAAGVDSAQLVIMVHWGTTTVYEDPNRIETAANLNSATTAYQEAYAASGAAADASALNAALMNSEMDSQLHAGAVARNAALLGYGNTLAKESKNIMMSSDEISMRFDLAEERYFVILMAYDNVLRMKERKSKLLWVTRLSIRSLGNDFTEALPVLASVGAEVFGKHMDDLLRVTPGEPRPRVTLGEPKYLGTVDDPLADKPDSEPKPDK